MNKSKNVDNAKPHRIQLRAGWVVEPTDQQDRMVMVRHFHRPSGWPPNLSVKLCLRDEPTLLAFELNGKSLQHLGNGGIATFDISKVMLARNRIQMTFERLPTESFQFEKVLDVWLELEESDSSTS